MIVQRTYFEGSPQTSPEFLQTYPSQDLVQSNTQDSEGCQDLVQSNAQDSEDCQEIINGSEIINRTERLFEIVSQGAYYFNMLYKRESVERKKLAEEFLEHKQKASKDLVSLEEKSKECDELKKQYAEILPSLEKVKRIRKKRDRKLEKWLDNLEVTIEEKHKSNQRYRMIDFWCGIITSSIVFAFNPVVGVTGGMGSVAIAGIVEGRALSKEASEISACKELKQLAIEFFKHYTEVKPNANAKKVIKAFLKAINQQQLEQAH